MAAGKVHSSELDAFVAECDRLGGPQHPNCVPFLSSFELIINTKVDQTLDPFSDEYFQQQLAVYREMSVRDLDQDVGEQAAVDVETNSLAANPYNSGDVKNISSHAKTITTVLSLAGIPSDAKVLDLGAGWGLSSEIMAFCGAKVTAVDINPLFVDLITRRAANKQLPITARLSNFDEYEDAERYDLAVFYECLHHAVRPWETLENIARYLKPNGKIAIAGEPICDYWKHWGIRKDALTAYCVRKYGWFESGWSKDFITKAFERVGFELQLTPHLGISQNYIGLAHRIGAEDRIVIPPERIEIQMGNLLRDILRPAKRLYEKIT